MTEEDDKGNLFEYIISKMSNIDTSKKNAIYFFKVTNQDSSLILTYVDIQCHVTSSVPSLTWPWCGQCNTKAPVLTALPISPYTLTVQYTLYTLYSPPLPVTERPGSRRITVVCTGCGYTVHCTLGPHTNNQQLQACNIFFPALLVSNHWGKKWV